MSGDIIQVHEAYLVDRKSVGITHTQTFLGDGSWVNSV